MRHRTRFNAISLAVVATVVIASMAPPAIAADEAATETVARRVALSAPTWLQSFLSWLNGIRVPGELEGTPGYSTQRAVQSGGGPEESPAGPSIDVLPQGGADLDPNG